MSHKLVSRSRFTVAMSWSSKSVKLGCVWPLAIPVLFKLSWVITGLSWPFKEYVADWYLKNWKLEIESWKMRLLRLSMMVPGISSKLERITMMLLENLMESARNYSEIGEDLRITMGVFNYVLNSCNPWNSILLDLWLILCLLYWGPT